MAQHAPKAAEDAVAELPPPGDPHTLYIVDISGYVFRAYHALPPLVTSRGEPTGAIYGVTSMLLKLVQERAPRLLAVAMDAPGRSFRHELYPEYKSNRPKQPEDLKRQMGRVRDVVQAYAVPCFSEAGIEADDLIASLTKQARQRGLQVVIVSADKDLLQLVGEGVWMLDTMRDRVFGPREAEAKMGVPPHQLGDLLALVGDSVDNVPGVPQVGPKTASQLLSTFGSLDGIYAHLEEVGRKGVREKLVQHKEQAYLSRQLVALRDDVSVELDPQQLEYGGADAQRLRALFSELEFTRLLAQLSEDHEDAPTPAAAATGAADPPSHPLIVDEPALMALAGKIRDAGRLALHAASDHAQAAHGLLVGLAVATDGSAAHYIPLAHAYLGCPRQLPLEVVQRVLGPLLAEARLPKLTANVKHDRLLLEQAGLSLQGIQFDTMLASYLLDPDRHAHTPADVARGVLDRELEGYDQVVVLQRADKAGLASLAAETAAGVLGEVARTTWLASERLTHRLESAGCSGLLHDVELPLAEVLAEMERTGVLVDRDQLRTISGEVGQQIDVIERRCHELAGRNFNVASPRQLETILFDELDLPVIKRTKTARSTDQSVLEELAPLHALPATILEHRMLAKLKNTYLDALPRVIHARSGRIHTEFRQAVAATGRISSSEPNLQNIPIRSKVGRRIRDAFVAEPGWRILSADYSQIELRVLAHLSEDPELLEAFCHDEDVHVRTAKAIFGIDDPKGITREMRGQAKTVNFAVIYGQTQFALARNLGISRSEATRYIAAFFERYAGVKAYMETVIAGARETGEVRTLLGRRRRVSDIDSSNRAKREAAERVARNTPIQGSAADVIKLAMIAIHHQIKAEGLRSRMLLTVHDELVFEAPPEEEQVLERCVRQHMESALELRVPLVVEAGWGNSWGEAH